MSFDFTKEGTAVISTTEHSLPAGSAGPTNQTDVCQVQLWLLIDAMAAGDEFLVQLYEKITSGGAQQLIESWHLAYPVSKLVESGLIVHNGWDITIKKLAGTDRTVEYSLRKVS